MDSKQLSDFFANRQFPTINESDISEEENNDNADHELFMELYAPSKGEAIALFLDELSTSQALIKKVGEIRERYQAGEWLSCTKNPQIKADTNRPIKNETLREKISPQCLMPVSEIAKAYPIIEEARADGETESLYYPGSLLYAMYPPPEEQDKASLEMYAMAEAIDTFLEFADEAERKEFLSLAYGEERK